MQIVSEDSDVITTTRLVAARTAVQLAHAQGQPAHAVRISAARRPRYALWRVDAAALPAWTAEPHCVRAALRGAVLSAGRLNAPDTAPHLEISCPTPAAAVAVTSALQLFAVQPRVHSHRGALLVTIRTAPTVGAALSTIGAQTARLQFEAGRVVRELRAGVNRRLNAETANLQRAATASVQQLQAAQRVLGDETSWRSLPEAVREAALLRIDHPDDDLAALARKAGCSRPAMAGRLQRLLTSDRLSQQPASVAHDPQLRE